MIGYSRRTILKTGAAALAATTAGTAYDGAAQDAFDSLRLIVGFPAGGTSDLTSRWIAEKLPKSFAKQTIVDNRPGAAGRIAVDLLKAAPPDGRTMLLAPSSVVSLYPHVYRQLSYDPQVDLVPVSGASDFVHALAVGSVVPTSVTDLAKLAAWAKANPSLANCGNPGEGSLPHLMTMLMAQQLAAPIEAVPYRGGAPAFVDLLGGRLAALMLPEGNFLAHAAEGKVRILGTSGPERTRFSPAVATFAEQGLTKLVVTEWFGVFLPGRAAPALAQRTAEAIRIALADKDLAETFAKSAMVPGPTTPAELAQKVRTESEFWRSTVPATGFKPIE